MQTTTTNLTGYPSIDRPWLKYYSQAALTDHLPEGSLFDEIWRKNKDHRDAIALEFEQIKITYDKLFSSIHKAAKAFAGIGVKKGDIVSVLLPTIPESVYCLYGLNALGAVCNFVDLRLTGEKLIECLDGTNSRIVVMLDLLAGNVAEIQNQVSVEQWILVSPFDSVPEPIRTGLKMKNKPKKLPEIKNSMSWLHFLRKGRQVPMPKIKSDENAVACIFHTSGTTSLPKSVMMTNKNMNAMAFFYAHGAFDLQPGDRFLSAVPPFLAYTTLITIHMPLTIGMIVILAKLRPVEEFGEMLLEIKPNHAAVGSASIREFQKYAGRTDLDLSFLKSLASGNDILNPETKDVADRILRENGSSASVIEGYGMTEAGSAASTCWPHINPRGSIGIPHCRNIISIFDPENYDQELTYGETGEICVSGPTVMPGYYGDPETTAKVLKMHSDGRIWLHSGDIGHMNEDGCIYFEGRIKRTIILSEGDKITPVEIENVIMSHENVDSCCVVGHPDRVHGYGRIPVAYYVLRDPKKESQPEIELLVEKHFPERDRVRKYYELSQLPLTPNQKIDYHELEKRGEEPEEQAYTDMTDEEIRATTAGEILEKMLQQFVPDKEDQAAIAELADSWEDQLALVLYYRRKPEKFREELRQIREEYSGCCPKCGKKQILSGYRREYDFWGSVREYEDVNCCRDCGKRWTE